VEFTEGQERATDIAKEVMALMVSHKIAPLPKSYTVLYAYVADATPDSSEEIRTLLDDQTRSVDDTLPELYDKYYGFAEVEEALADTAQQMESKMSIILDMLAAASGDNKDYGDSLHVNIGDLKNEPKNSNLSVILDTLVDQTESILQKNESLLNKLEASSEEVNSLRENLGTAKREALVDGLTGVANRKCFDLAVNAAVSESSNSEKTLCIAMTDIDFFKDFNDTYGHQTGDKVLIAVAQIINKGVREEDIVARYGGEEFALILPDMELAAAFALCERIRVAVSCKKLRNRKSGQDMGRINISIGLAQHKGNESASDLLKRADACLYQAKESGRNMTIREALNSSAK